MTHIFALLLPVAIGFALWLISMIMISTIAAMLDMLDLDT